MKPMLIVLAWCEARKRPAGVSDWDDIRILLRRSTDDGKTWSLAKSIAEVPGPKTKNPFALRMKNVDPSDVTYNNPVLIADTDGTVHMLFCLEYMRCFYQRSDDEGQTWSVGKAIEAGPSMYSDLAVTRSGTILCFYGRGTKLGFSGSALTLARFNLEWLTRPTNAQRPASN